jgi:hypothetical protein
VFPVRGIAFLLCLIPLSGAERAAYDSAGRLTALMHDGVELDVRGQLMAVLPGGKRLPVQTRLERSPIKREANTWSGPMELPDGGRGRFVMKATESVDGVKIECSVTAESAMEVGAIEYVIDVARDRFAGGKLEPAGTPLTAVKPADAVFHRSQSSLLRFVDGAGNWSVKLDFGEPRKLAVVDRWDRTGRSYQVRAALREGALDAGKSAALSVMLSVGGKSSAPEARISVDASKVRYRFDGFGANFCFGADSPVAQYKLDHLKIAWARFEMKLVDWDRQRPNPGPRVTKDLEMMQRVQKMGVPYAISIWWLPERLYTDPNEKPRSTHRRQIAADQWDNFLELVGSYLLYARQTYGVEPDLFSFNEANIGVYVLFSPEEHAMALKRIGAHFRKLGLKTRMMLGDATGPRGTHEYVLAAAADAEAMQYVGAVSFHTWGGATPEQYAAWGDVGEWLGVPLLAAEVGVDAWAHSNRMYDSYHYGLREAQMQQELILYARPAGTQFWEFTGDYGLAKALPDGSVEPTPRFWLMKHFTDLTPQKSSVLATTSDQKDVLVTAFRGAGNDAVHIVNLGAARSARVEGLPDGYWKMVVTTEEEHYQEKAMPAELQLPARGIVTLVRGAN